MCLRRKPKQKSVRRLCNVTAPLPKFSEGYFLPVGHSAILVVLCRWWSWSEGLGDCRISPTRRGLRSHCGDVLLGWCPALVEPRGPTDPAWNYPSAPRPPPRTRTPDGATSTPPRLSAPWLQSRCLLRKLALRVKKKEQRIKFISRWLKPSRLVADTRRT